MYSVYGYSVDCDGCNDFNYIYDSFVDAVKTFKRLQDNPFLVVFFMRDKPDSCLFIH